MKVPAPRFLTTEEVLSIHDELVEDFIRSNDPIEPSGIKSHHLLESAVARQHTSLGGELKYSDPVSNAASLCYGVCSNHPFHNGNKRTALVAMLCHLDRNGLTLTENVTQSELYSFMLKVASHHFAPRRRRADTADIEVGQMTQWLHGRIRQVKKGERFITYRELRVVLRKYGYELENPKGNAIDIVRYEWRRTWPLFGRKERIRHRCAHISYPGDKKVVGKSVIKSLRRACHLTEDDGIDSEMFYSGEASVDHFIAKYKKTLKRLARV
jgi:death-on-curing protein